MQADTRIEAKPEMTKTAQHSSVNEGIVNDAYGPAASVEAQKIIRLMRNANSPIASYDEVAGYLDKHNDSKSATSLVQNLNKFDEHILADLSVVYEKHQLADSNDGLAKHNSTWDSTMAHGVERSGLIGYAREKTFDLGDDCPFASPVVTANDVNAKLADMHLDGKAAAMLASHREKLTHLDKVLQQTVDVDGVKFEGLARMIDDRNLNAPGQAAKEILVDDNVGALKTPGGIVLHLTPMQRNALETHSANEPARSALYPDLYYRNDQNYSRDYLGRSIDERVSEPMPRLWSPEQLIQEKWRKMTHRK